MTATKKAKWAYKVVKSQRGGQGQWFRYPAALTTADEAEAIEYAERFAAEQAGVSGTRILVLARKGDRLVREIKCD
jgi:hypothetical protein